MKAPIDAQAGMAEILSYFYGARGFVKCLECSEKTKGNSSGISGAFCVTCLDNLSQISMLNTMIKMKEDLLSKVLKIADTVKQEIQWNNEALEKCGWQRDGEIEVTYSESSKTFNIRVFQNGACIENRTAKHYDRYAIRGIVDERSGRIPWKSLFSGEVWRSKIMLSELYLFCRLRDSGEAPNKVVNFDAYRPRSKARLVVRA